MRSAVPGQSGPSAPREAEMQCIAREENEAAERSNGALAIGAERKALQCECGDPGCDVRLALTHAEYEDVRAYGSRFLINLNHENPENTVVLSENARFAVIDVVGGVERHEVLERNPRHLWVEPAGGSAQ